MKTKLEQEGRGIWSSLKRGWQRNAIIFALAVAIFQIAEIWPALLGDVWAPMVRNFGLVLASANAADILLRLWQPYLDNRTLGDLAEKEPLSASITFAARIFLFVALMFIFVFGTKAAQLTPEQMGAKWETAFLPADGAKSGGLMNAPFVGRAEVTEKQRISLQGAYLLSQLDRHERELRAYTVKPVIATPEAAVLKRIEERLAGMEERVRTLEKEPQAQVVLASASVAVAPTVSFDISKMPANAQKNYPLLLSERQKFWDAMREPSLLGAQTEQETCYKLTHPKCWTANAELNITSKHGTERGCGFGQLTKVVRANGQLRFDNLTAMRLKYPKELGNYGWDNCNDPVLAMRAYVLFMRDTCKNMPKNAASVTDMFSFCLSAYNGGEGGLRNDILSCRATAGCDPTRWKGHVEHTSAKAKLAVPGYGQSAFAINRGYVKNVTEVRRPRYLVLDRMVI